MADIWGLETGAEKGSTPRIGGMLQHSGRALKNLAVGPFEQLAEMSKWPKYTGPDGETVYQDPATGYGYSEQEYQKEYMRRSLAATLHGTMVNSAPGVGPATGEGVVAGANRIGLPANEAESWLRGVTARTGAERSAAAQANAKDWVQNQVLNSAAQPKVPFGFKGVGEKMPAPTATPILNDASLLPSAPPQPFKANALTRQPEMGSVSLPSSAPTMKGQFGPMSTPTRSGVGMTPAPAISAEEAAAVGNQVRANAAAARPAPPPFPPPTGPAPIPGRAPMPAIPTPPPVNAPPAAVRSWFGKLSAKQKAGLGIAAGAGGITPIMINRAAETARKQQAQPAAKAPDQFSGMPYGASAPDPDEFGQTMAPTGQPAGAAAQAPGPAAAQRTARFPSRAGSVLQSESARVKTATSGPATETPVQGGGTDKVPVTTTGRPDYNYYAEIMNASDRNDAYARDLINLKEQARMAAIDAAARGEKFRFVPVKDYMNNRIIFVNAGGNDVVLDMNDPRQGVEYQKLLDKAGIDPAAMTDWIHRSSKPVLRYMQPVGGNRDVTPDFGFARRSVEMGAGGAMASPSNVKLPDIAHVTEGMPKVGKFGESRGMDLEPDAGMPTPTATPPSTRPEPQPTAVASVAPQPEEDPYAEVVKRAQEQRKAAGMTPAQARRIDQSKRWVIGG